LAKARSVKIVAGVVCRTLASEDEELDDVMIPVGAVVVA
jgi:hypothetical protein